MSRGMTLIEVLVGIAIMGVVSLVVAGLLKAGIMSSNHGLRYALALSSARKGLDGDGSRKGLLWAIRESPSVGISDQSSIVLGPSNADAGGGPFQYLLSQGSLYQIRGGTPAQQAPSVTALEFHYYKLDQSGRIQEVPAAAQPTFVTAELAVNVSTGRTYRFLSGGRLQNAP